MVVPKKCLVENESNVARMVFIALFSGKMKAVSINNPKCMTVHFNVSRSTGSFLDRLVSLAASQGSLAHPLLGLSF